MVPNAGFDPAAGCIAGLEGVPTRRFLPIVRLGWPLLRTPRQHFLCWPARTPLAMRLVLFARARPFMVVLAPRLFFFSCACHPALAHRNPCLLPLLGVPVTAWVHVVGTVGSAPPPIPPSVSQPPPPSPRPVLLRDGRRRPAEPLAQEAGPLAPLVPLGTPTPGLPVLQHPSPLPPPSAA